MWDSNPRPSAHKTDALPTELNEFVENLISLLILQLIILLCNMPQPSHITVINILTPIIPIYTDQFPWNLLLLLIAYSPYRTLVIFSTATYSDTVCGATPSVGARGGSYPPAIIRYRQFKVLPRTTPRDRCK